MTDRTDSLSGGGDSGSFTSVAPYYDHLMRAVPYRMWVGYYLLLLSKLNAHPKSMLEIGCGTGTLCELLSDEGFELTGVDLSPAMIKAAKEKNQKRQASSNARPIQYHVGDASEMSLGKKFDAAFSFFDSLNNILDPSRLQMALKRAADHLQPGGSFIFDLNTPYAFEEQMFDQHSLAKNAKLRYKWVGDYSPEDKIITVTMDFWWQDQKFREVHRQRAYTPEEVIPMLELAGFQDVSVYHSYCLEPPRKTSDRIHYTALLPS